MRRLARCLLAAVLFGAPIAAGAGSASAPLVYPEARRDAVVDQHFGEAVGDPYRWLEGDVRGDPAVARWVADENALSRSYLDALPQRAWFAARIRALLAYERFGLPVKAGRRYFYTRIAGQENQPRIFVRNGFGGKPRLLLDPNAWSADGTVAVDAWRPSRSGRYLVYSVQDGGSDWRTLRLLDVGRGAMLAERLDWVKFSELAWIGDEGFLYSRFPAPAEGTAFQAANYDQAVWFHTVGTPQAADQLVYATPAHPEYRHTARVTADGRYAVITSSIGTDARHAIHFVDLSRRKGREWKVRTLDGGFEHDWKLVESSGRELWFVTNREAPLYRLVAVDVTEGDVRVRSVVSETAQKLERAAILGDKLLLSYLVGSQTHALLFDMAGKPARMIALNGIGTASGFRGRPGDPETFYSFSSFNYPSAVYRLDLSTGETMPFAEPALPFAPGDFAVERRSYLSKDGTQVPLFLVRSKVTAAAGKPVPTLLYGYGGFDVSLTPGFSAARMAWLEAGGAFAMANLRGGGEYGTAWHEAGRRENKQNVFDDFIAAGEYLIAEGITPKGGLAIQGGSNGGLLVAAVLNQRPDLFAAANPQVPVTDMLRFDRFTSGRYWIDDYGDPSREADYKVLRAYSPYHNIRAGTDYPAVLVTTGDGDDRVVPAHSFKYIAALQAAGGDARPHLLRVETRAGHGTGKPTDKLVEEGADVLAFLAQWTGLVPGN